MLKEKSNHKTNNFLKINLLFTLILSSKERAHFIKTGILSIITNVLYLEKQKNKTVPYSTEMLNSKIS